LNRLGIGKVSRKEKEEKIERERKRLRESNVCFHFKFICWREITVDSSTLVGKLTDMKEKKTTAAKL